MKILKYATVFLLGAMFTIIAQLSFGALHNPWMSNCGEPFGKDRFVINVDHWSPQVIETVCDDTPRIEFSSYNPFVQFP